MKIELFVLDGDARTLISTVTTNADGRTDRPMLDGGNLKAGTYELVFYAGAYLAAAGVDLPEIPFLDLVPIRFGISDTAAHYHVPLLISPYAYSTYRGS
jgi:5-hydroxyisourate hydrolase